MICRVFAWCIVIPAFGALEFFFKIRITPITTMRIGGLTVINHFYMAEQKLYGPDQLVRRLFFGAAPCNRYLFDMWKRVMPIIDSRIISAFYQYTSDILERLVTFRPLPNDKGAGHRTNTNFLVTRSNAVLSFNEQDLHMGRELLARMGVGTEDWFVCFHARDSKYQSAIEGNPDTKSHRNAPLVSYLDAAEYITEKGGFAIRMGQLVEEPLPDTGNPRIVDYATQHRSDFGDVFLPGQCRFFLASASGYQQVPALFGRPVATAHLLPLVPNQTGAQSLYIPKLFRNKQTGEYLTYDECFSAMGDPKDYPVTHWDSFELNETATYAPEDNSPIDVLDLCRDMFDQLEDVAPTVEALAYQRLYMDKFFRNNEDFRQYGPRISPRFAYKYRHLIDPTLSGNIDAGAIN